MNFLRTLSMVLLHLLKLLAYEWIFNIYDLAKRFVQGLIKLCAFLQMPHPDREETGTDCTVVNHPSFHRPDPCIYSQDYLLKLGLAVTWDNPDIVLRLNGVIVPEGAVLPDTDYVIEATVWNNSYEAPAVGVSAAFSFLSFGVGTAETAIGATFVNLGVKGGANHPALARMPWRTPATPGHYCLRVALGWIDDANPANNVGQNNLNVVAPQSPAPFTFQLRNATGREASYRFEVDAYEIPALSECKTRIERSERGTFPQRLERIRQRHDRSAFPVPAGWLVEIAPQAPTLPPGAEIQISVKITSPPGFAGRMPFNVNALHGNVYAGGVSLIVQTN